LISIWHRGNHPGREKKKQQHEKVYEAILGAAGVHDMNAKPHKATPAQLELCRRDPTQADKIIHGLVVCLKCGEMVARLTRSPKCHARRAHPELDYEAKWPTAPVYGIGVLEADRQKHQDFLKNNRVQVNVARRKLYGKKLDKAEVDPNSKEAAFIQSERKRTADLNYENYWGAATPEGVKQLEAAARANPEGPEAEKLRAAAAFREREKKRKKARIPRMIERARELLEERIAAAKADPLGPEAVLLKAQRKRDRIEAQTIRDFAKVGRPAVDAIAKATGAEITDIHAQAEPLSELVSKVIPKGIAVEQRIESLKSLKGAWKKEKQKIGTVLASDPHLGNPELQLGNAEAQRMAGVTIPPMEMKRLRTFLGIHLLSGRQKGQSRKTMPRTGAGRFHRKGSFRG
jgi:hypothetical protein